MPYVKFLKIAIIYKFTLIILLIFGLLFLILSSILFAFDNFVLLEFHKYVAVTIFVVALLHIYSKRKKFIKLLNEFLDVIFSSRNPSFCNMERLIATLQDYTIAEISARLEIDCEKLMDRFRTGKIKFKDQNQTLRQIAKLNDEKIFYAIVLILEMKFSKNENLFANLSST